MAEAAKKLVPRAVVGTRVEDCLILAAHPDDVALKKGMPLPHGPRTIVRRFDGARAVVTETVAARTFWAWSSSSGHSYAAPSKGDYVMVHAQGRWSRETISNTSENVSSMWGWPGQGVTDDLVFISAETKVFLREQGRWRSLPVRASQALYTAFTVGAEGGVHRIGRGFLIAGRQRPVGGRRAARRYRRVRS